MSRIDLHTHFIPDVYRQGLENAGVTNIGSVPFPKWSLDQQFASMDELGIDRAILSLSAPGVEGGSEALAVDLARATNDQLIDYKARFPDRLGGFATLPVTNIDLALAELERLKGSGLEGVVLITNSRGRYLSHPDFIPLLDVLNARKLLVFIHPGLPEGTAAFGLTLAPPILEFVFDTTRTVADLIFSGRLDRYPDIRWILAHLGGTLPFVAWRMSMMEYSTRGAYAEFRSRGHSVYSYLQRLYYDTAVSASPASLRAVLEIVEPSQIVFGSDTPFLPPAFAKATTAALDSFDGLSSDNLIAANRGNALRLLSSGAL